eukprot:CAMPEP_0172813598 /NCGR_PEP_ID=MMETSP1075-20121228/10762_1 /TAXON_ID=2916 /ORGANISM="Ceratium fusus, Strain PA161109" /LENGTH=50 /DNA_ID=CAMNT_0013653323 /DNA_START=417 /DNA_END=569 /DNA_ORIENTATION=+
MGITDSAIQGIAAGLRDVSSSGATKGVQLCACAFKLIIHAMLAPVGELQH